MMKLRRLAYKKEQIFRFKDQDNVQSHIKKALKLFQVSSSKRKKRLIQLMVPKLVLDEKQNQLFLFINPFLESSAKISIEKIEDFSAILPKNLIQSENEGFVQAPESSLQILSQRGKNVGVADKWRTAGQLCKLICFQPLFQGVTPLYVVPLFKNKFFIHQKYVVEGLSAKQIAREIFSSKMAVLDALYFFEIPIREPHYNHGHPSQPRYGQRVHNNALVDHLVEQKVIAIIRDLHAQGFSLRKIARILNGMRVATKCHGKGWHPQMVRRVLDATDS